MSATIRSPENTTQARRSHRLVVLTSFGPLYFLVSAGTFSSLGVVLPAMVQELGRLGA